MNSVQFAPNHATRIGQQFGSYLIEGLLGRGAFATVFLGRHLYLDMKAAINTRWRWFSTSCCAVFLLSREQRQALSNNISAQIRHRCVSVGYLSRSPSRVSS